MVWIIVIVVLLVVIMMASSTSDKNAKALSGQAQEDANWKRLESIKMSDPNNQPIYDKLVEIYQSCEPLYENSILSKEKTIELCKQISGVTNERDADYLSAMQFELLRSREITVSTGTVDIQLKPCEKCYFRTKNSILNTVQKLCKTVTYSGLRYNFGAYRLGTLTLNSKDIEGYQPFGGGSCYITNQRVVFTSNNNKNKVIPLSSIISYAPYEENAVLLNIANSSPVIINFPCTGMFNITKQEGLVLFTDDKMHFLYALDSVLEEKRSKK